MADYALLDTNFRKQNGTLGAEMVALHASWFGAEYVGMVNDLATVPEPASMGILGLSIVGMLVRRRSVKR